MALAYRLETLDGVEENVQSLYTEKDGAFVLSVEGVVPEDDVSGLKQKVDQLLTEKKTVAAKAKEMESKLKELDKKKAEDGGDFKTLWEQAQAALAEKDSEITGLMKNMQTREISAASHAVAAGLASDPKRASVLADYVSKMASFEEDGVRFVANGVKVDTAQLSAFLKKEYPFLVDGSSAAGGGSSGSSGSGAAKEIARSEFDKKDPAEKMKFIKSGGVVID